MSGEVSSQVHRQSLGSDTPVNTVDPTSPSVGDLARRPPGLFHSVTDLAVWIGCAALIVSILIVFIDVCGRYLFNSPLMGGYEVLTLTLIIMAGPAIMFATIERGHVSIDLLVAKLPRRIQIILGAFGSALGFASWGLLAYYLYLRSATAFNIDERTSMLRIPVAPVFLAMTIAIFLCSLAYLREVLHPADPTEKSGLIQETEL